MASVKEIQLEGNVCYQLDAACYTAILAPELGNNMIRLHDNEKGIEVFRFDEEHPYTSPQKSPEVYGYPFLYLPNRLSDGRLKTSDALYHLPINETGKYNNTLHGFLNKRAYTVVHSTSTDDTVSITSRYIYDEHDDFFTYFPVSFQIDITYTLSNDGLLQEVSMTNLSNAALPIGLCSHTPFKGAFVDGTKEEGYTFKVPITTRWELNHRCIPTTKLLDLTPYDQQYNEGTMPCTNINIDNDLYTGGMTDFQGKPFHGAVMTHEPSGKCICYEVSKEYQFWCMWNDNGTNGYFCPEPMTWMIDAPNLDLDASKTGYVELKQSETYTCWQHIFTK